MAKVGSLVAAKTIALRGGCVNERIYGWRNLYCGGRFAGRIERRVANAGRV